VERREIGSGKTGPPRIPSIIEPPEHSAGHEGAHLALRQNLVRAAGVESRDLSGHISTRDHAHTLFRSDSSPSLSAVTACPSPQHPPPAK
jgi:hypothetical protein